MRLRWLGIGLVLLVPSLAFAGDTKKSAKTFDAKPRLVPFRLTDTHHTLVRVKINGKGPFNFIVDTGCPVFLIAEPVGKKIGLKTEKGWAILDSLHMEGGLELKKVKARVETPFQIEGMNGMGLAGVELHGLMGYTVLAKYKMHFDYTEKQMLWTPLRTEPLPPVRLKGAKAATGGMDMMVSLVRILTFFAGLGPPPPPQPRGFFGFEMEMRNKQVIVARVLADSPAAKAGLKKGDRITNTADNEVGSIAQVLERASKITAGKTLTLTIERGKKSQDITITADDGF
ncbi:MAG: PDZ domain-containing protein [Planctomycetes bacterium]|nr:PDZ domain-containing protein [Planctomycetota bacterium]